MSDIVYAANQAARGAIQALLNGEAPLEAAKEEYGDWASIIDDLKGAYAAGGTATVRRAFTALCRTHLSLAVLVASDAPAPTAPPGRSVAPPLPSAAAAILAHEAPCGQWLDDYIAFAQAAAPMTPRSFHEAAGLFALSIALGRRVVLRYGIGAFYPNLYMLWIGPSTLYRKSTALRVLNGLLRRSGVSLALLSEDLTPEALLQDMSLTIPTTLPNWSAAERERWLQQRAIASQRAVLVDEASFLFSGLHREYKEGLLGLLLKIYDCPDEITGQTISRGRLSVAEPSLAFFGVSTPKAMEEHLRNELLWANGLWRRFALVVPDSDPVYHDGSNPTDYPPGLVRGLERIHSLVELPTASLTETEEGGRTIELRGGDAALGVTLGEGVLDAWRAYTRAMSFDLLVNGAVEEHLHPSYGHLGTQAIKVAMVLAAADATDGAVHIERRHLARAIAIVERWRVSLHALWNDGVATDEARLGDRVLQLLQTAGPAGLTTRDMSRSLHRTSREVREAIDTLQKAGALVCLRSMNATGREVEKWAMA